MIITICGSRKNTNNQFMYLYNQLTQANHLVFMPYLGDSCHIDEGQLTGLHLKKIAMSDAIVVLKYNLYYDEHTKKEIEYALSHDKIVYYVSTYNFEGGVNKDETGD